MKIKNVKSVKSDEIFIKKNFNFISHFINDASKIDKNEFILNIQSKRLFVDFLIECKPDLLNKFSLLIGEKGDLNTKYFKILKLIKLKKMNEIDNSLYEESILGNFGILVDKKKLFNFNSIINYEILNNLYFTGQLTKLNLYKSNILIFNPLNGNLVKVLKKKLSYSKFFLCDEKKNLISAYLFLKKKFERSKFIIVDENNLNSNFLKYDFIFFDLKILNQLNIIFDLIISICSLTYDNKKNNKFISNYILKRKNGILYCLDKLNSNFLAKLELKTQNNYEILTNFPYKIHNLESYNKDNIDFNDLNHFIFNLSDDS